MTEEQLKEALVDLYESEFKDNQTFEEFADMLDFWIDKNDNKIGRASCRERV